MRNIIFYEFLNCRPVGTGATAPLQPLKLQKSPTLPGGTENKHLAQEARISFLYTDAPL